MPILATLDDLRRHLGLRADETADDARLLICIETASADLERECGRHFEPRFATLTHRLDKPGEVLSLADDLLELTALVDGGGAVPLAMIERIPECGPAALLRLAAGLWFAAGTVAVTGWWGWHDDPAALWQPTGQTVLDDPLTASATILTLADSSALSPGHLLRLDDELVRIQTVEPAAQVALRRGQHGTEAVSHPSGTPVEACAPPPDVRDLVLRWAAWLARRAEPLPDALRVPALRWRRERV